MTDDAIAASISNKFMRRNLFILLIIFSCSCTTKNKESINTRHCKLLSSINQLNQHEFNSFDYKKIDIKRLTVIDSLMYKKINNRVSSDLFNYFYGQFPISENRLGLVCYNKTTECDHDVYYYSLQIIDNCTKEKWFTTLSSDNSGNDFSIYYDYRSSFNKTFDVLTVRIKHSSEWILGTENKTDTMFTDIYKIDLKSINIDTIYKSTNFKTFKRK